MTPGENPHGLCTWRDSSSCADCNIQGLLKCRHSYGDLLAFFLLSMTAILPAGIGMYLAGYVWFVVAWALFAVFFFNVWETKILCSHCPYYAKSGKTLVCIANHGCLKLWEYSPAPMSRFEKAQFVFAVIVLAGMPFPFLILGAQWLMLTLTCVGMASWYVMMRRNVCSACVNFSCPLNKVPKNVVDCYLERNPAMRNAWEKAGYRLG